MCESVEKVGQDDDDETERRHSRFWNRDRKVERCGKRGESMQIM